MLELDDAAGGAVAPLDDRAVALPGVDDIMELEPAGGTANAAGGVSIPVNCEGAMVEFPAPGIT